MKRVIRASEDIPKNVSILDFESMSADEIEEYLKSLPIGSKILDVCSKPDRHQIDTTIEKRGGYAQNMFNRMGSPNDSKFYEVNWCIGGYKDPYFGGSRVRKILDGIDKYYQISPRAV